MSNCTNNDAADFKLQQEKSGRDPFMTEVDLQRAYSGIDFLTKGVGSTRTPFESITGKGVVKFMKSDEYTPELKEELGFNIQAIGEQEAIMDFIKYGKIRSVSEILTQNTDYSLFPFQMETMTAFMSKVASERALSFAETLSKALNVPYHIITESQFKERFPNRNASVNPAFYQGGEVFFVEGYVNQNIVFHEFSHPVIKAIRIQNPEVFNELWSEFTGTLEAKEILKQLDIENELQPSSFEYQQEALVRAMELEFQKPTEKSFIKNLFYQVRQFLRKIFGKDIDISKLKVNTKLKDLVQMLNEGTSFSFENNIISDEDIAEFKTEYSEFVEPLRQMSTDKTQELINEFYLFLEGQITALKSDSPVYNMAARELVNEDASGQLEQMRKVFSNLAVLVSNKTNVGLPNLEPAIESEARILESKIRAFAKSISDVDIISDVFEDKIEYLKSVEDKRSDSYFDAMLGMLTVVDEWVTVYESTFIPSIPTTVTSLDEKGNVIEKSNPLKAKVLSTYNKMKELQRDLSNLQTDSVIDLMYDHYNQLNDPIIEELKSQMQAYRDKGDLENYKRLNEQLYGLSIDERAELRYLSNLDRSKMKRSEIERYQELTKYATRGYELSKDSFIQIFSAQSLDSSRLSGLLESYANNQDAVVSTFYMTLKSTMNELSGNINSRNASFINELQPLLKAAGYDNKVFGEGGLGNAISTKSRSFKRLADESIEEHEEIVFLSNYKNWEYDYEVLKNAVALANKEKTLNNTQENQNLYYDALEALEDFEEKYMHRDYSPAYYELFKVFRTPIGRKAKEEENRVYELINLVNSELAASPNDELRKDALIEAWSEYRMLASPYDYKGDKKTGDALEIANLLSSHRKALKEFHDWVEVPTVFENSFQDFIQDLNSQNVDPLSDQYNDVVADWMEQNTSVSVADEYYQRRTQLMQRRSEILSLMKEVNQNLFDLTPLYEELNMLTATSRDEYNVIDGTQMTIEKQNRIVELHDQIEEISSHYYTKSGFSKADDLEYSRIRLKSSAGQTLSFTEQEFMDMYNSEFTWAAANLGISKTDLIELNNIQTELSGLTDFKSTEHYISEMSRVIGLNEDNQKIFERFAAARGYSLAAGELIDAMLLDDLIHNNLPVVYQMLDNDPHLKKWFRANHYLDPGIKVFDQGRLVEIKKGYRKTASWKTSNPRSEGSYNSKSATLLEGLPEEFVKNGKLVYNGVPVVPNRQYYSREVKNTYKTEKIKRDFVNENGELVLANVDNKNKWLPRDFSTAISNPAFNDLYIDSNYKSMFKNNRSLWNLLDYLKTEQLDNEMSIGKNARLYMQFPTFRKGNLEGLDRNYFRRKVLHVKEFVGGAADDYDQDAFSGVTQENPYIKFRHPISGNFKIDSIDVSTNIVHSVMQRMASIEQYKLAQQKSSMSFALERALKESMIDPKIKDLSNSVKLYKRFSKKKIKDNSRIDQVDKMIDRYINGVNLVGTFKNDITDRRVSKVTSWAQRRLAVMSFAFNYISSFRNYFGAKFQIWKKALGRGGYSFYDLLATRKQSGAYIKDAFSSRYQNKIVPVRIQLLNVLDAIPDRSKTEAGIIGSKTAMQDLAEGTIRFFDRKYLNDSGPVHQIYAMMHSNKVDVNGLKMPLYDAVQLVNGRIETVDGVEANWKISYDKDGSIILGQNIKKMMNEHDSLMNKNMGVAGKMEEADAYRSVIGKLVFTMVKFFPGMLMDRYQFKRNAAAIRGGKFRITGRRNLNSGRLEMGTMMSVVFLAQEAIDKKGRFWAVRSYSPEAVRGFYQLIATLVLQQLLRMMILGHGFDADDDDKEDFTFDPEVQGMFSRIKSTTSLPNLPFVSDRRTVEGTSNRFDIENYMKLQSLNLLTAVEQEEATFNPLSTIKTGINIATLNNALSDGGGIKVVLDMLNFVGEEDKDRRYKKDSGPYVWQGKEQYKAYNYIGKYFGLNGTMFDPGTSIERRYNFQR